MKTIRTLLLAGLFPLLVASALATDGTWGVDAAGNWSDSTKWSGSNIANGAGATANLTFDITAARIVTLAGVNQTVGILNIGDPSATPAAYTLAASGGAALTLDNSGSAAQINLSGTTNNISVPLQLTAGGLIFSNNAGGGTAPTISGGISSAALSGTQIMTLSTNGSGVFSFTGAISNGNTGGAVGLLLNGGTIGVTGANSFTGGVTISKGILRTTAAGMASGNGNIQLGDANTGANVVTFSPNGGTYTNNFIVSSSGTGSMSIESSGTTPAVSGISGIINGTITLGRSLVVNAVGGGFFLNGDISGAGGLTLGVNGAANNANAITISGNNSFSGGLKTNGNIPFNIGSATATGATASTWTIGTGTTTYTVNLQIDNSTGSALTLTNNNAQIWSNFTFNGTNDMNMGTGGVTISTGAAIVTVLNNKLTVGGVISGTKNVGNAGPGTLALTGANTYTGITSVGGVLAVTSLANGGSASNIGQAANTADKLVLNRGTLQYTGGTVTTDHLFTIGNGGGTIESSGAGALTFGNGGANVSADTVSLTLVASQFTAGLTTINVSANTNSTANLVVGQTMSGVGIAAGTTITQILDGSRIVLSQATTGTATASSYTFSALDRTLTLTGSNAGANTIAGVLADAATKTLGVTKTGAGTWILSGANTYTGLTTVSAGTLGYGASNVISTGAVSVNGATAVLDLGANHSDSVGTVTVAGGGSITGTGTSALTSTGSFEMQSGSVSAILNGSGIALNKTTGGTVTLSAANTYTGATLVSAGTLVVSAGHINSSAVTVAAGGKFAYNSSTARTGTVTLSGAGAGASNRAILGGTGTINTAVTLDNIGDTLSPGNSPGIQNYATNQTWNSFTYLWETNNFTGTTAGTDFDQITITGSLNLSGGIGAYLLDLNSLTAGNVAGNVPNFSEGNRTWTILTTTAGISGFNAAYWTIATGNFTSSPAWTGTWAISQSSNDLVLSYGVIPEPSTWALLAFSLTTVMVLRRRKS